MGVLYVETKPHLRRDLEWTWYTDDTAKIEIWEEYILNYEDLTIIAPYNKKVCDKGQADLIKLGNIHELENQHITLEYVDDVNESSSKVIKGNIEFLMEREIKSYEYELIVVGNDKNYYQKQAIKYAKKYNKEYQIN